MPGSPELLDKWITTGFNSQAVAGYGTSVEFLKQALVTGEIPWGVPQDGQEILPYQQKILAKGGYLYFAYPFVENLQPYKPKLVKKLRVVPNNDLTHNSIHDQLSDYARRQAVEHHFESLTDIKRGDDRAIVFLTYLLFPDLISQFKDDEFLESCFYAFKADANWQAPPDLGLNNSTIPLPRLKEILASCVEKRGLIIYYNEKILRNRVLPGFELESEIMIHTKKPLTLAVISGIKPLAKPDIKALHCS
ncbi:hypothetical protein HYT74_01340 [Candidatus Daviesbacteria bacterium]|nr:hypothetical protein [Candidatus Daviesbacteria bacterium]